MIEEELSHLTLMVTPDRKAEILERILGLNPVTTVTVTSSSCMNGHLSQVIIGRGPLEQNLNGVADIIDILEAALAQLRSPDVLGTIASPDELFTEGENHG